MKMIYSQFNTIIEHQGYNLLFNTLNKQILIIENDLREIIFSAIYYNDFDDLLNIHPEFYKVLLDQEFLISSEENEFLKAVRYIENKNNDLSKYKLIVNPTMNCNFKCWYCYENHIKDSKMSSETLNKITDFIGSIINKSEIKTFELSFFGGEPFLYYQKSILPLIKVASYLCVEQGVQLTVSFTTNGYLLTEKTLGEISNFCKNVSYQITLDGDENEHDKVRYISNKKGSYKKIVENIKLAASLENNIVLRINYTKDNFSSIKNLFNDFKDIPSDKKKYINISMNKVWQETFTADRKEYDEIKSIIREMEFKVTPSILVDAVENSCYADKLNHSTINYDGNVYKCTARDFDLKNHEGKLSSDGNIIWNDKNNIRNNNRFSNKPCRSCFLFPMCAGGCSQHALENYLEKKDYCVHNFDNSSKEQFILDYLEDFLN